MEEGNANWYVSLFGSENELKQLHGFLDSPSCRLVQFKEISTQCYLTACRFSNLTDSKKVFESAKTLLMMIRAFAKVEHAGDFLSINVGQGKIIVDSNNAASIVRQRVDGRDVWVFPTTVTATASVSPVEVSVSDSVKASGAAFSEPSERQERLHDYYLNQCDEEINRDVIDALFYYAEYTSWHSLWKVFETITLDINSDSETKAKGQIDNYGWADEDKLNDFGYWAQYYDAVDKHIGLGSRHSRALYRTEEYKPKQKLKRKLKRANKPPIMEIQEADKLMGHLLKKWLESKRPETMTFHCFSFFASLLP